MALNAAIRQILSATAKLDESTRTDGELLRLFAECRDEGAFATLVKRHLNLVSGVCRRSLSNHHDAEDACQAVFYLLAQKAGDQCWHPSIANWLYSTARRVARDVRRAAERRSRRAARSAAPTPASLLDQMSGRELLAALDDELEKLPAIYREPLVLHYLEGLSRNEAAVRMGIGSGTMKIRLERGRLKLADALSKRGLDVGAALVALSATAESSASTSRLVEAILAAAAGAPSASIAAIAKGATLFGTSSKVALLGWAMAAVTVTTVGAALMQAVATRPAPKSPPAELSSALPELDGAAERERLDRVGASLPDEALGAHFVTAPAPLDMPEKAISKAVEKDGLSVSIGVANRKVNADEQPVLKIRFDNTSRRFMPLYDVNNYGKWRIVFTKAGAADTEPKTWRLIFDTDAHRDAIVNKEVKGDEPYEVTIDLENDPQFTFSYVAEAERSENTSRVRHLKPGKYEVKATVSLESHPFASWWTGPVTTEPVQFTVLDRQNRPAPSKEDLAAYDKALQPTIDLTKEKFGLWMNGARGGLHLAKDADPEDVIAAVVNMNRSNIGTKAYRVLRIKRLEDDEGRRFVALISAGKATKALLCFPIADNQWWSRVYGAAIESAEGTKSGGK